MASPPITEASEIRRRGRQRLIGAIALVAVLVVFVPMVLDSDPRPPRPESSLAIPPKADAPPLPPPPKAAATSPSPTPEPQKAAPAKLGKAETAAPAAPRLEGFAVQVGAFRDEAKLAQARQKLTAAGIAHYIERLDVKAGPLTRLRAGPFPTRAAAESALAELKLAAVDGKVVPLP